MTKRQTPWPGPRYNDTVVDAMVDAMDGAVVDAMVDM